MKFRPNVFQSEDILDLGGKDGDGSSSGEAVQHGESDVIHHLQHCVAGLMVDDKSSWLAVVQHGESDGIRHLCVSADDKVDGQWAELMASGNGDDQRIRCNCHSRDDGW
jgi:hypothetical protein